MIEIKNVVKTFDGFHALDGVDMNISDASVYALVGPNGAGKTTLMNTLCGIYTAENGSILCDGKPIYENNAVKSSIVYIPDDVFYFHNSTIEALKNFYKGIYKNFDEKKFNELASVFPNLDRKATFRRLSKGMKKQAAFWIALCCNPKVLVLDEPVDGLDPMMRHQVWKLIINEVAEKGITVLVSSHNLRELEDVCDTVGIMNRGKIFLEAKLDELKSALVKIQVSFENDIDINTLGVNILREKKTGRIYELIVGGDRQQITEAIEKHNPLFIEELPMTLEEIFIYEMGEADDEIRQMLI